MSNLFQVCISAVGYFFFNREFFKVTQSIMQVNRVKIRDILWSFILNYAVFIVCSRLELHLIINWLIFLGLLWFELRVIFHQRMLVCFVFSLLGTQLGLAINIFSRSLLAAALNVPLFSFDNQVSLAGNIKIYPVLFGFFLTAFLFWITRRYRTLKDLSLVLSDTHNLMFLTRLLVAMYLYLILNLFVYYNGDNSLIIKLWSMKSSVFVMVGEMLTVILAMRLAQLHAYRKESIRSKQIMEEERIREEELRVIATSDPLTGCENRLLLEKRLEEAKRKQLSMGIAFIDLNGLKFVNDTYGHDVGDMYLLELTSAIQEVYSYPHTLYRYGGDEFILLFEDSSKAQIDTYVTKIQEILKRTQERQAYAFPMSFSYGVVFLDEREDISSILQLADTRMYEMKKRMQKETM